MCANAGIYQTPRRSSWRTQAWQETIDINLGGVWETVKAAVPHLVANKGGSIIFTSSVGGHKAYRPVGHYIAAKHGVVGMMRSFADEFARRAFGSTASIRPGWTQP